MLISSVLNQTIKDAVAVKDGKGSFVLLEGENLLQEAIKRKAEIKQIFATDKKFDYFNKKFTFFDETNMRLKTYTYKACDIITVTDNVMSKLCDTKTPQGIVSIVDLPQKNIAAPKGNFLVLEGIQDPGNLGTILRSAVGANFMDIYLINCASYRSGKAIRSSMGAVLALNLYAVSINELTDILGGSRLYACDMNGKNVFTYNVSGKFGLAIGNEGNGLTEELKKLCSDTLSIPMQNNLESLNAGIACGIMMYSLINRKIN